MVNIFIFEYHKPSLLAIKSHLVVNRKRFFNIVEIKSMNEAVPLLVEGYTGIFVTKKAPLVNIYINGVYNDMRSNFPQLMYKINNNSKSKQELLSEIDKIIVKIK